MQEQIPSSYRALPPRSKDKRGVTAAILLHASFLALLLAGFHHGPRVAPYRLPGTAEGVRYLMDYNPGTLKHAQSAVAPRAVDDALHAPTLTARKTPPKPASAQAPSADAGTADSTLSGIGQGNISIALQKVFPYPKPDLSALPRGTHGDVILDATIDEQGNISALTLVAGLGQPIDGQVMATVKQWSYTPAMKDGVPVVSEQELHFHYERG